MYYHLPRFTRVHRMEKMFEVISPLVEIKENGHIIDGGCSSGASTARIGIELAPTVSMITGIDLVAPGIPNPKEKIPDFSSVLSEYEEEQPELVKYVRKVTSFIEGDLFFPDGILSQGVEKGDVLVLANNLLNRFNALKFNNIKEIKELLLTISELLNDLGFLILWSDSSTIDETLGHEYSCIIWQKRDRALYLVGDEEFYTNTRAYVKDLDKLNKIS